MNCPKCSGVEMVKSDAESGLTKERYRCPNCATIFDYMTATGRVVEVSTVLAAVGAVISIAAAIFGGSN